MFVYMLVYHKVTFFKDRIRGNSISFIADITEEFVYNAWVAKRALIREVGFTELWKFYLWEVNYVNTWLYDISYYKIWEPYGAHVESLFLKLLELP